MWHFISDWRMWLWFIALSFIATAVVLYFMPPAQSLTPIEDEDNEPTADHLVGEDTEPSPQNLDPRADFERQWQKAFDAIPPSSEEPPPLPLWRRKQLNDTSTTIVRWIDEEIKTAPDDVSIVFKLYAEAAEVHSVLVGETMITAVEVYAQFLKAAADWEKTRGTVHTFSAEVIWGGETRGWLNFTL